MDSLILGERQDVSPWPTSSPGGVSPQPLRVLLAMRHRRLRGAVGRALEASGAVTVCGQADACDESLRIARATDPNVVVVGKSLLGAGVAIELCGFIQALDGLPVVVVGLEQNDAYRRVVKESGGADYVLLDGEVNVLEDAIRRAAATCPTGTLGRSARRCSRWFWSASGGSS